MKRRTGWTAASLVGLTFLLTWGVCCESAGRRTSPEASGRPERTAETPEPPAPPPAPTTQPAAPAVPESPGGPPPLEEEPPPPDYVTITERFHDNERSRVDVTVEAPDHLTIDTRNVRRLRIDRERLPLRTNRSIVLRLDGQGIEWTARSKTVEFERSVNGVWTPVRPDRP